MIRCLIERCFPNGVKNRIFLSSIIPSIRSFSGILVCFLIVFPLIGLMGEEPSFIRAAIVSGDDLFIIGESSPPGDSFRHLRKTESEWETVFEEPFDSGFSSVDNGLVSSGTDIFFCVGSEGVFRYSPEKKDLTLLISNEEMDTLFRGFYDTILYNKIYPCDLCIAGGYLYVMIYGTGDILRIDLSSGEKSVVDLGTERFASFETGTGLSPCTGFATDGKLFYFACPWTDSIMIIDAKKKSVSYLKDPQIKDPVSVRIRQGELAVVLRQSPEFILYNGKNRVFRQSGKLSDNPVFGGTSTTVNVLSLGIFDEPNSASFTVVTDRMCVYIWNFPGK